MRICRLMVLAALMGHFLVGAALAAGGGYFVLVPGEARTIEIASTYREIHICNDMRSVGDLQVAFPDREPVRLAPGVCRWGHGDHVGLRNDSKSVVFCLFQIVGKHQS
jgi:hypothetical protein